MAVLPKAKISMFNANEMTSMQYAQIKLVPREGNQKHQAGVKFVKNVSKTK